MKIKLKYLFEMIGHITYYLGYDWRKLPMSMRRGIHKNDNLW